MMNGIWTMSLGISLLWAFGTGSGPALAAATLVGCQKGVTLAISMAGSLCLWSGVGRLMDAAGILKGLTRLLKPFLGWLFPSAKEDAALAGALSANFCANLLGLGNAATPMGIQAAKSLRKGNSATDELCRLVVFNTASIQLLPTNVAAVRSALGSGQPFDILPEVWLTSLLSVMAGLLAAQGLRRFWK